MGEISYRNVNEIEDSYETRYSNWKAAVGLQAVDGLSPSKYLADLAEKQIKGEINYDDVTNLLKSYYEEKADAKAFEARQDEADLVSANIAKILATKGWTLNENSLKNIHRKLFAGFNKYTPGKYRTYDIYKKEWILDGDTIQYGHHADLEGDVAILINNEKAFDYSWLSSEETIEHYMRFIADIWKLHVFLEGNTRTTAIFVIKLLRSHGIAVDNKPFERNSKYFRNALARANYWNGVLKVNPTLLPLRKFFGNLLLGEDNELKNRDLHIDGKEPPSDVLDGNPTELGIK